MKWLNRELISCPFYVGLIQSENEFDKFLKKYKIDHFDWITNHAGATTHFLDNGSEEMVIICINKKDFKNYNKNKIYALLVHEAVHIYEYTKKWLGNDIGEEIKCYIIQSISLELFSKIKINKK